MQTKRLTQVFRNTTKRSLIISMELSTSRYRLAPEEELLLFYDAEEDEHNAHRAPLVIEFVMDGEEMQLTVWTVEVGMFHSDGTPARMSYD